KKSVQNMQKCNDRDRRYFSTRHPPKPAETVEILLAASKRAAPPSDDDADVETKVRVLELLRRIAGETDLTSALRQIALEAQAVADAERAQVWLYDVRSESLTAGTRRESAAVGLTSYVARTGCGLAVEELSGDPRYDPDLDNDSGDARERFL